MCASCQRTACTAPASATVGSCSTPPTASAQQQTPPCSPYTPGHSNSRCQDQQQQLEAAMAMAGACVSLPSLLWRHWAGLSVYMWSISQQPQCTYWRCAALCLCSGSLAAARSLSCPLLGRCVSGYTAVRTSATLQGRAVLLQLRSRSFTAYVWTLGSLAEPTALSCNCADPVLPVCFPPCPAQQTTIPVSMPRIIADYVDSPYARSAPNAAAGAISKQAAGRAVSRMSGPEGAWSVMKHFGLISAMQLVHDACLRYLALAMLSSLLLAAARNAYSVRSAHARSMAATSIRLLVNTSTCALGCASSTVGGATR